MRLEILVSFSASENFLEGLTTEAGQTSFNDALMRFAETLSLASAAAIKDVQWEIRREIARGFPLQPSS